MTIVSRIMPAVLGLIASTSVFAATGSGFERLQEGGLQTARLDHCSGYVTMTETYKYGKKLPLINFYDIRNCSVIYIDGVKQSDKLERRGAYGFGSIVIQEVPGKNVHRITLESGSGATSDTVEVVSYGARSQSNRANIVVEFGAFSSELGAEKTVRLNDCGGEATIRIENGDKLTLIFRDVKSCSKFDILSADGGSVNYPRKDLQVNRYGEYTGSFTIPKRYVDFGNNAVKVVVRSNSGAHDEVILVKFKNY